MKRIRFFCGLLFLVLLATSAVYSQQPKLTTVRVIASEYYDEYQLPDNKKWQQVESILIEGQSGVGSIRTTKTGPCDEMEAILQNVVISSEYFVTITWQGGEQFRESYVAAPQRENVHRITQPF